MEAIFLAISLCFCPQMRAEGLIEPPQMNVESPEAFWPPDMVPHPHPPGGGPSGPSEPEMA